MMKQFGSLLFGSVLFACSLVNAGESTSPGVNKGELLQNSLFKSTALENFPDLWHHQYNKLATYKMIDDVSFKRGFPVLQIDNPTASIKPVSIRTKNFLLPAQKKLEASVWAKGSGMLTIFVIQSDWKGTTFKKIFPISPNWKKYSFSFELPKDVANSKFHYRTDCSGKGRIYLANPSLRIAAREKRKISHKDRYLGTGCSNLVVNSDFELGWAGWHPRYFNPPNLSSALKQLKRPLPEIRTQSGVDGSAALYMPAGNNIESLCMPLQRGKTYTISAFMKADKVAEASINAIDYKWKSYGKRFRVGTEWKRYSVTFTWEKPCYFDEVYLRCDAPRNCGMLIDEIQFSEGAETPYVAPPVTIGVSSKSNIYGKDEKTNITLKSIPSKKLKEDYSVSLKVTDYQGKEIWKKIYKIEKGQKFETNLNLPTKKYGLNIIDLKAFNADDKVLGIGLGRYAVVRSLPNDFQKGYTMGVNVYPFYYPLEYYKKEVLQWKRLGAGNALSGYTTKYANSMTSPEFIKLFKGGFNYFKDNGYTTSMRVGMPPSLTSKVWFNDFPAGENEWQKYVGNIVKTYSDVTSLFTFMGEINIYRMREGWRNRCKKGNPPPNGTHLMPPDKGFKYYKSAYLAAKKANPSVLVGGPSLNGRDYPYIKSFMSDGAAKYMDVFGMDAYRAGPDTPEAYADYMELRHTLSKSGFIGPIINLEQYLGICVKGYLGSAERSRTYFTPWNEEARYAGVVARNYIQHAAAGIVWINFAPEMSLFNPYQLDGGFPSMAAPATAAATLFLNQAGTGIKVSRTNDIKAFFFSGGKENPLLIVYTPNKVEGTILIKKVTKAFDGMGNEISNNTIKTGLPVTGLPIYLRFPSGTTDETIKDLFADADIRGFGAAFDMQIIALGEKKLAVDITNKTNKVLAGNVKINNIPSSWKGSISTLAFKGLQSGEKRRLVFAMEKMPLENLGKYPVSVSVSSGSSFAGKTQVVSPMFANHAPILKASDGFADWKISEWINIDADKDLVYDTDGKFDKQLKAKFATAWNKKGFALKVKVADSKFNPPSETAGNMYIADSIQVYFDQLKDARPGYGVYNNNDVVYQIGLLNGLPTAYLEQGPEGRYLGSSNTLKGVDKDVDVNISYENGEITYDIFFPSHTLRFVKLKPGEVMGFSLFVHDKDGKEKCGISLSRKSPFKKPYVWKDLILRK